VYVFILCLDADMDSIFFRDGILLSSTNLKYVTDEGDANSDSDYIKSAERNPPHPNVRITSFLRDEILYI
jgi:hypothetical protein